MISHVSNRNVNRSFGTRLRLRRETNAQKRKSNGTMNAWAGEVFLREIAVRPRSFRSSAITRRQQQQQRGSKVQRMFSLIWPWVGMMTLKLGPNVFWALSARSNRRTRKSFTGGKPRHKTETKATQTLQGGYGFWLVSEVPGVAMWF